MALKSFDSSTKQIVSSNHRVATSHEKPFIKQVKALNSVLGRNECPVDLPCFQVNRSDLFIPTACKKKVMLLMDTTVEHRIGKLIDFHALVRVHIPLPDGTVLG